VVVDVVGVVGAIASVVGAAADVDEEAIGADRICASSMVMAVKLLKPVVWSTMNVMPPAMAAELGMMAILFV